MSIVQERLRLDLRDILSEAAEALLDYRLASMEQEISEGWAYFHAREIWFKENIPPPLINELGRHYMCEQLRSELYQRRAEIGTDYKGCFLRDFFTNPDKRLGYRNFLDASSENFSQSGPGAAAPDAVVHAAVKLLLEVENRHARCEMRWASNKWYIEASLRGTLTPPLKYLRPERKPLIRDENYPLGGDLQYWWSIYHDECVVVADWADRHVQVKPDCSLELMRQLAPDFPYAAHLSTASRLVFLQEGDSPLTWTLIIEKGGASEYRYPPSLLLCRRNPGKKWREQDILFKNVIAKDAFYGRSGSPRGIEVELLFHLPRSRRLIQFYTPFVEQAIGRQT